jgi:hypothetical protein
MGARHRTPRGDGDTLEREYERLNPGSGGPPSQQQERGKRNPRTSRDDGGAALSGGSNADVRGPRKGGPQAGNV